VISQKSRVRKILVFAAVLCAISGCDIAAPERTLVTGTMHTMRNTEVRVSQGLVTAVSADGESYHTGTDSNGQYEIELPRGLYTIFGTLEGSTCNQFYCVGGNAYPDFSKMNPDYYVVSDGNTYLVVGVHERLTVDLYMFLPG